MKFSEEEKKELKEMCMDAFKEIIIEMNRKDDELVGWEAIEEYTGKKKRRLLLLIGNGYYNVPVFGEIKPAIIFTKTNAWGSRSLIRRAEELKMKC